MNNDNIMYTRYRAMLLNCFYNDIPIYSGWLGKKGLENFTTFWEKTMKRCRKEWKEEKFVPERRKRALAQLTRLVTDGTVPYYPPNMTITRPSVPIKIIGNDGPGASSKNLYGQTAYADHKEKGQFKKYKACRVPTEEDIPVEWRRYDHNGRKVSFPQKCAAMGFPPYETTEIVKKKPELTIEEAGKQALKYLAKSMVTMSGKKVPVTKAAEILIKQYPKFTYVEMLQILTENDLNMGKIMTRISKSSSKRKPVYIWDEQGFKQKFESVQVAAVYFGITEGAINTAIGTEAKTKAGVYFTRTDNPPSKLENVIENNEVVMQLFESVSGLLKFSLSETEYEIIKQRIQEMKSDKSVSNNMSLTVPQIKKLIAKAFESVKKSEEVLLNPKGVKNSKTLTLTLGDVGTPWQDHSIKGVNKTNTKKDIFSSE